MRKSIVAIAKGTTPSGWWGRSSPFSEAWKNLVKPRSTVCSSLKPASGRTRDVGQYKPDFVTAVIARCVRPSQGDHSWPRVGYLRL
jgi:hypothetical protein